MPQAVTNTPQNQAYIASAIASGMSQTAVAKELGVTSQAVCKRLPKLKDKIETLQAEFAERAYKAATDNIVALVNDYGKDKSDDPVAHQRREHGFKASVKVAESMGLLPSHTPSLIVQNAFVNNGTINSPIVDSLLSSLGVGIVDAEFSDDAED